MSKMKFPTEYIRPPRGRIAQSIVSIGEGDHRHDVERPKPRSSGTMPTTTGPGYVPKPRR